MRINLKDSDVPMPSAEDVMLMSGSDRSSELGEYVPKSMQHLAQSWLKYLHLSVALAQILKSHYRPGTRRPSIGEVKKHRESLNQCFRMSIDAGDLTSDPDLLLFSLQLDLYER